ncbi:MAG: deoxyguanosinetriphosphate triphosphohydrolase [Lachnospiraceae bacterium]|nr:deoxyguanosinetriphosphate triphosphohydrolase [Lachnospiraceae bacterium]
MEWKKLLCPDRIRDYKGKPGSRDLRTEFEKDYHRIIGSASFRRLQDKTQVFPLDQSDFIRTRLTHSLEVSSLAKSLGQNVSEAILQNQKDKSFLPSYKADVCDILQCAGLLHDIGNPPFGHFGEAAIRDWFQVHMPLLRWKGRLLTEVLTPQMQADFYHFEGNTQALRLVTRLHYLVDAHGMNLTKALLGTIIKYPVSSLEIDPEGGDIRAKKMGYFLADEDVFQEIQESTGTCGRRHPLAFLLEAADDIAYRTADIEDAVKKGCLTYERLLQELKGYRADVQDEAYRELVGLLEYRCKRAYEKGMDHPHSNAVQNWLVQVQGEMIHSATEGFMSHYEELMAGQYKKDLFYGISGTLLLEALGDIAYRYAFISTPILKLEIGAGAVFDFLLGKFTDAAILYDSGEPMTAVQKKLMSMISDNYRAVYHIHAEGKDETERLYLRLLLVTDEVCGMTDSYAKTLYQELSGIR